MNGITGDYSSVCSVIDAEEMVGKERHLIHIVSDENVVDFAYGKMIGIDHGLVMIRSSIARKS